MSKSIVKEAAGSRKLTEMQVALLEGVYKGLPPTQAGREAGYSENSIATAVRALKDELVEIAEMVLVQHAPKAAQMQGDILTSDVAITQGALKLSASQSILDRVGLGKKDSLKVEHEVTGGIFVLPAKAPIEEKVINE